MELKTGKESMDENAAVQPGQLTFLPPWNFRSLSFLPTNNNNTSHPSMMTAMTFTHPLYILSFDLFFFFFFSFQSPG
jgi:hypothetical protein